MLEGFEEGARVLLGCELGGLLEALVLVGPLDFKPLGFFRV